MFCNVYYCYYVTAWGGDNYQGVPKMVRCDTSFHDRIEFYPTDLFYVIYLFARKNEIFARITIFLRKMEGAAAP